VKHASRTHRKTLRRRNAARRRRLFAKQFHSRAFVAFVHAQPCVVKGCTRPSECMHVVSRGAGGTWRELVPGCRTHHGLQHNGGIAWFQRAFQVDLTEAAAELCQKWARP